MVDLAATVWRDFVTDGVPSSGTNKPHKLDIRRWGAWLESLANLAFSNGKVYSTKAALDADLTPAAFTPAIVVGDPAVGNDGLYMKVGGAGAGSWLRLLDFVPGTQIVHAVDVGAGTPNAIVATTSLAVSAGGSQIVRLDVFEANTGSPVTVSFNGGAARTIKTASGNDVVAGGLTAGPVLGVISGSTFRLLSDQASAAILAAAEAAVVESDAAAALAQQYAADAAMVSGVNVPIYAAVASASGSTIVAGVKSIKTQFYNPSYVIPATLNGGANYARMSKVDIDAAALPALAYFRSVDRFMPDGTTNATNGGYWVISEPILSTQMLGAKCDGVTVDTAAVNAALALGRPVFSPEGTSVVGLLSVPAGVTSVHLYGVPGKSILQAQTADTGILFATGKNGIHIHDLKVVGANTVQPSALHSAITIFNSSKVNIHDVELSNWMDRGVYIAGTASTNTLCKNVTIERVRMAGQVPSRFAGSCIYIGECTQNIRVEDCDLEDANGGIFVQNVQATAPSRIRDIKLLNNRIRRMQQYGIITYFSTMSSVATGMANNGSGRIRVTAAAHGLTTGDQISMAGTVGTVEANDVWLVTVIDANTFDLNGSTFTNAWVSGGSAALVNPNDVEIAGNTVEDVYGGLEQPGSNGNFGAGIYTVGGCDIDIHDNIVRRSNLTTSLSTLAPGGIGCTGHIGTLRIADNTIEDCFWYGIYVPSVKYGKTIIKGNTARRCHRSSIFAFDSSNVTIEDNNVEGSREFSTSQAINVGANAIARNIIVANNNATNYAASPILALDNVADFTVAGNVIINEGPSTLFVRVAQITDSADGAISGNNLNGKVATSPALYISAVTNTQISGNNCAMTDSGAAPDCVSMLGVCTGTAYHRNNRNSTDRMNNTSTGGQMHTRASVNTSGSKTRQIGDTIENTVPSSASVAYWFKIAASAGGADWKTLTLSA